MGLEQQWALIRAGYVDQGIDLMRRTLDENPNPSNLVTLALGHIWAERYVEACLLIEDWISRFRVTMAVYASLVGVSRWCLGDVIAARESFYAGLGAQYRDLAEVELPLLLWVCSVLRQEEAMQEKASQLLRARVESPKVRHWPGPLAQLILGRLDEDSLTELSKDRAEQKMSPRRYWQVNFYRHVLEVQRGELTILEFKKVMQVATSVSGPDWTENDNFLQLVRNPEFYLARHEASSASQ